MFMISLATIVGRRNSGIQPFLLQCQMVAGPKALEQEICRKNTTIAFSPISREPSLASAYKLFSCIDANCIFVTVVVSCAALIEF